MIVAPRRVRFLSLTCFICLSAAAFVVQAQTSPDQSTQNDPLARPRKHQKPAKAENAYGKWKDEVRDIITDDELGAFVKLTNDAERASFVETFWRRRDPTPDTEENEYKEEFYRRRAYADEHFSAGMPGSKTDRGRVYIIHGPPDSIDAHPSGGPYQRTAEEGGGFTTTYPFETWRYRNIDGIGQEIEIEFVDTCACGAYHITTDPGEKDAESKVPNAGLSPLESMGVRSKADRGRTGLNSGPASLFGNNQGKDFDKLNMISMMLAPPSIKFKGLQEVVKTRVRYNLLPFDVRVDFVKASADTVTVPITVQVFNQDLTYVEKDGLQHATVNLYGRVTAISGKIVNTFEDTLRLDVPPALLHPNMSLYQQRIPLRPGRYRLDLVLKDVNGDKLGTLYQPVTVPDFSSGDKLGASTLILADEIEPVPARDLGRGAFVFGPYKIRPRVPVNGSHMPVSGPQVAFSQKGSVNLWMQVYNLEADAKSAKTSASVEYRVVSLADKQQVYLETESPDQKAANGNTLTLRKELAANKLKLGVYDVTVTVTDQVSKQSVANTARFEIW